MAKYELIKLDYNKVLDINRGLNQILYNAPLDPTKIYYIDKLTPKAAFKKPYNRYLRVEVLYNFAKSDSGTTWSVSRSREFTSDMSYSVLVITRIAKNLETLTNQSRLLRYENIYDDNDYFTRAPLINELAHLDNWIEYYFTYMYKYEFDSAVVNGEFDLSDSFNPKYYKSWDKFSFDLWLEELEESQSRERHWQQGSHRHD